MVGEEGGEGRAGVSGRRPALRVHRDIYPATDHGYTWAESAWIEDGDGCRLSPVTPVGECSARNGDLPAGKMLPGAIDHLLATYAPEGAERTPPTETIHVGHFYAVRPGSITHSLRCECLDRAVRP